MIIAEIPGEAATVKLSEYARLSIEASMNDFENSESTTSSFVLNVLAKACSCGIEAQSAYGDAGAAKALASLTSNMHPDIVGPFETGFQRGRDFVRQDLENLNSEDY